MSTDPKSTPPPSSVAVPRTREHGIKIFTYPKVIFIFPTMIAALVCGLGMSLLHDETADPLRGKAAVRAAGEGTGAGAAEGAEAGVVQVRSEKQERVDRFKSPQNLLGILFLGVFGFNLIVMGLDFPRFTIFGILLLVLFATFFFLWVGAYFEFDILDPVRSLFGRIYAVANAGFYYSIAGLLALMYVAIYITRYLDYWEMRPNEILHHHGPMSDLERFPTLNLKFDKEIPDVFEFLLLGAGRLVFHVASERKSIVLDNVLFINSKEVGLKNMMSRLDVRVTTDQEVGEI